MNPWAALMPSASAQLSALNPWGLTERQCEVLEALARTGRSDAVAEELRIHKFTVATHVTDACQRAKVKNRIQLVVAWALWRAGVKA
jgi:DNA-binding NarL/FixJ family response regulator